MTVRPAVATVRATASGTSSPAAAAGHVANSERQGPVPGLPACRAGRPVGEDAGHVLLVAQLVGEFLTGGGHRRGVDGTGLRRDQEYEVALAAVFLVDQLLGLAGLGRRVVEPAVLELAERAGPEHGGRDEHDARDDEQQPRP